MKFEKKNYIEIPKKKMQQQRDFKGVWIEKEIWLDKRLNALEKIILMEIDSLDNEETGCYASNQYLVEFCQCSETKVSTAISKLIGLDYLYVKNFDGRTRILKSRLSKFERQDLKNLKAAIKNLKDNNIINNKNNNKVSKRDLSFDEIISNNVSSEELKETLYEFINGINYDTLIYLQGDTPSVKNNDLVSKFTEPCVEIDKRVVSKSTEQINNIPNINNLSNNKEKEIFDFWNSQNIIIHNELDEEKIKQIRKSLKENTLEDIKKYIERYSKVLHDKDYYFDTKWTLIDFLKQKNAMPCFSDEGSKWLSYINQLNKKEGRFENGRKKLGDGSKYAGL